MFVVGSGGRHRGHGTFEGPVSVPVIAPEEPQLALARGAALASANAPRYDASTVGLAYSQDPDGTTVYPLALADDATTFLGHADSSLDTADIASDPDDVSERSKPFSLVGSSLTAIFAAGMIALTIAMVIMSADRGSRLGRDDGASGRCGAAYRGPGVRRCAAAGAQTVPAPPRRTTTCGHRDGTADGSARPAAAASGGAQRCTRPGRAATRAPSAARCASAVIHRRRSSRCRCPRFCCRPPLQPRLSRRSVSPGFPATAKRPRRPRRPRRRRPWARRN